MSQYTAFEIIALRDSAIIDRAEARVLLGYKDADLPIPIVITPSKPGDSAGFTVRVGRSAL